ncbi:hypothetical protein JL720_10049 [Aureococcus anophagefferens]|nr:hypothetical protein JL720_10049 [Aureococcus anophagefferens]
MAEKRYQRRRSGAPTDFGDVVDCRPGAPNSAANAARLSVRASGATDVAGCPGLAVFPGALDAAAQRALLAAAFSDYHRGTETNLGPAPAGAAPPPPGLRWATLGRHYDWSRRAYDAARAPCRRASRRCAALAAAAGGGAFAAEAAIVNYYAPGDTMGGHVDDAEHDLTLPPCRCRRLRGRAPRRRDATRRRRRSGSGPATPSSSPGRRGAPRRAPRFGGHVPPELADAGRWGAGAGGDVAALCAFAAAARVNVNVRQVDAPPPGAGT